mmetsp:Transcript_4022/g.6674  ORF Transcript_4022/g.6674 Transcript_4022/m.6674 type:complete len:600 (-) Transcript_4022:757-2556(-)
MIDYFKGVYGINLLFRVYGSALYKGSIAGIFAVIIYLLIELSNSHGRKSDNLDHPYGVGVLISSVSLLIIFRANFGYQRYWEGVGAVQHAMSKFMDATMHSAVFHLQSKEYDGIRPPSFFDHDNLNKLNLTRDRRRQTEDVSSFYMEHAMKSIVDMEKVHSDPIVDESSVASGNVKRSSMRTVIDTIVPPSPLRKERLQRSVWNSTTKRHMSTEEVEESDVQKRAMLNFNTFPSLQVPNENFASRPNGQTPPLFLQELAHISSLLCAVTLSTLRNDIEDKESLLDVYSPGSPWPAADPDKLPKDTKLRFQHRSKLATNIFYFLGLDRLPGKRNMYNVSRPLPVLGGVSDCEVQYLRMARGPYAKAELAFHWFGAFVIREHLNGSMGDVHSAIISRIVQFVSDGQLYYNQARKIMFIPFPFPHAQLSVFFTLTMIPAVPFLMDQYCNNLWSGCILSFLTVTCLVGLHEVARELEHPFRNVPNEVPLCTLQAMYNETLVTMFSGYNPDFFWDPDIYNGALHAMAMSKVYQRSCSNEMKNGETNRDGVGGSVQRSENVAQDATAVADDEISRAVKELQDVLAKQANEIEELERVLDSEEVEG